MRSEPEGRKATTWAADEIVRLQAQNEKLSAVVEPLEKLIGLQNTGWLNISWSDGQFVAGVEPKDSKTPRYETSRDTLPEALSALLAQLMPPEPKWIVEEPSPTRRTQYPNELAAIGYALHISTDDPLNNAVKVFRDGKPVCVFIDGERFNKAEGE